MAAKDLHTHSILLFNKTRKYIGWSFTGNIVGSFCPLVAMTVYYNTIDSWEAVYKCHKFYFSRAHTHTQATGQSEHPDSDCKVRTGTGGSNWVT